jgi:hypothetical protein
MQNYMKWEIKIIFILLPNPDFFKKTHHAKFFMQSIQIDLIIISNKLFDKGNNHHFF